MKLQRVENVVQVSKVRRVYKIFTGKPHGKQLLGKVDRLENTDNIKWNLEEWAVKK
jgi:hypothetical protein